MSRNISEFIRLLLSYDTSVPVPPAAMHAPPIALSPPCFTDYTQEPILWIMSCCSPYLIVAIMLVEVDLGCIGPKNVPELC